MNTIAPVAVTSDDLSRSPARVPKHVPGPAGHWLRGNLGELLPDPGPFLRRSQRQFGNCFSVGLLRNRRVVVWMGREANTAILSDREELFSIRHGWDVVADYFGRNLLVRDFADHRIHRKAMTGLFKTDAMARYIERMWPHIDRLVSDLDGEVDVYARMKRLALDIALDVFAGFLPGRRTDRLLADLTQVLDSVMAPRIPLPGSLHWRGMRARDRLRRALLAELPARRDSAGDDMFTQLARHEDDDGRRFSDSDVIDHMFGMLFAAHDTTASALAMLSTLLAQHPDWQARLVAEVDEVRADGSARPDRETFDRLALCDAAFRETLRLYAPIQFLPRRSVRAFNASGIDLPANTHLLVPVQGCHLDPEVFPEPEAFRPDRFEQAQAPQTFVPFGGGAHMCLGMHFAALEVKAVLYALLSRRTISASRPLPEISYLPVIRPAAPLVLQFDRRG